MAAKESIRLAPPDVKRRARTLRRAKSASVVLRRVRGQQGDAAQAIRVLVERVQHCAVVELVGATLNEDATLEAELGVDIQEHLDRRQRHRFVDGRVDLRIGEDVPVAVARHGGKGEV